MYKFTLFFIVEITYSFTTLSLEHDNVEQQENAEFKICTGELHNRAKQYVVTCITQLTYFQEAMGGTYRTTM